MKNAFYCVIFLLYFFAFAVSCFRNPESSTTFFVLGFIVAPIIIGACYLPKMGTYSKLWLVAVPLVIGVGWFVAKAVLKVITWLFHLIW